MATADRSAAMKRAMRDQVRRSLQAVELSEIHRQSALLAERVTRADYWRSSTAIALFDSMPAGEIQTAALIERAFLDGKRVYLPRAHGLPEMSVVQVHSMDDVHALPKSKWGIREPPADRHDALHAGDLDGTTVSCNPG